MLSASPPSRRGSEVEQFRKNLRGVVALAGLHRVPRGAEVALESIASGLSRLGHSMSLVGTGPPDPEQPYGYQKVNFKAPAHFRKWPTGPLVRDADAWSALFYGLRARRVIRQIEADYTMTCGFPWEHFALRSNNSRHVFVTQNGNWPVECDNREFRWFRADGIVCTNPGFFEQNRDNYRCALIGNGINERFRPGDCSRHELGLPSGPIVGMVSGLIESKRVSEGMRMVSQIPDVHFAVFGDGILATEVDSLGKELFGERYLRRTLQPKQMPSLYRSIDVLLHMSQNESFGNVYIEAAACGLPVVAHRYGVTNWIFPDSVQQKVAGQRIFLVDTSSPEDVRAGVESALRCSKVAEETNRLSADVRGRFSWERVALQYDEFIREVVAQ